MNWLDTLRSSRDAIFSHRLRSFLTMLGILIGIAGVILTVGLGLGARQQAGESISSLGSNLLIVSPGSTTSGGVRGGFGSSTTLTQTDATALASPIAAPDIVAVAPVKTTSLAVTANSTNWTTSIVGTSAEWASVRSRTLASGSFFSKAQVDEQAAVAVLGSETATELFGYPDVIGQSITINNVDFEVIGVLAAAGSDSSSTNLDDQVIAPLSTVANRVIGGLNKSSVSTIYLKAGSADQLSSAYQEAQALLLSLHGITDSESADFSISSQQSLLATATSVSETLSVLLTGIAALSLLVGGIGVMNIMLVSVSERTREIGLRKAIGAPPSAVRRQFLLEASILGLAGGLLGAALGIAGATVARRLWSAPVVISPVAVGGSIAIALVIGVLFGVYPATRAARLAPIDALRSE